MMTTTRIRAVMAGMLMMASGAAIFGLRSVGRAGLRGNAMQLSAAIRYCYDRSITTNGYYRLVLDFDQNAYWAERSEDKMLLARDKEQSAGHGAGSRGGGAGSRRTAPIAQHPAPLL